MTSILAYSDKSGVYMASDSQLSLDSGDILSNRASKLHVFGDWIVALSGPSTFVYSLTRPSSAETLSQSPDIHTLSDSIHSLLLSSRGFRHKSSPDTDELWGPRTTVLVGRMDEIQGGQLWDLCFTLDPIPIEHGRVVGSGSGSDYAQGAFQALYATGHYSVVAGLTRAIEVASKFDVWTGGDVAVAYSTHKIPPVVFRADPPFVVPCVKSTLHS